MQILSSLQQAGPWSGTQNERLLLAMLAYGAQSHTESLGIQHRSPESESGTSAITDHHQSVDIRVMVLVKWTVSRMSKHRSVIFIGCEEWTSNGLKTGDRDQCQRLQLGQIPTGINQCNAIGASWNKSPTGVNGLSCPPSQWAASPAAVNRRL